MRELNPMGGTVWEINRNDLPDITLHTVQEVDRLANGNTVISNWFGSVQQPDWPSVVQAIEVTPDKKVVGALRDWTNLPIPVSLFLCEAEFVDVGEVLHWQ